MLAVKYKHTIRLHAHVRMIQLSEYMLVLVVDGPTEKPDRLQLMGL
jgi:hypothetical protein